MIKVQDWTASIPEEEKHIAYVGENMTEQREFLLCGEGWEKYKNWSFHLDMAFDPTSITTRDCRQVVQTTVNNVKHTEEVNVTEDSVTTKETYTVCDEEVLNYDLTDVASLDKWVEENGIRLTWTVLRQHTLLPGKLRATIRAVGEDRQTIKKSAMMVFEVEPSVEATPAAMPPVSQFEQMEAEMDALRQLGVEAAESAMASSVSAASAAQGAVQAQQAAAEAAESAMAGSVSAVSAAQGAVQAQQAAAEAQQAAAQHAEQAEEHRATASAEANAAVTACADAKRQAQAAEASRIAAAGAVSKCSEYVLRVEESAEEVAAAQEQIAEMWEQMSGMAGGDGQANIEGTDIEQTCIRFAGLLYGTDKAESFLFFTDPHLAGPSPNEERMLHYLNALKTYYNATPTTFALCGGDWLNDTEPYQTDEDACYKLGRVVAWMNANFDRWYTAIGNHEDNTPFGIDGEGGGQGTNAGLSNATIRNILLPMEENLYYSFDGAHSKCYVLNTSDFTYENDQTMTAYRWEQIAWLAERLKGDDADNSFITMHAGFTPYGAASESEWVLSAMATNVLKLCEAYNKGTAITLGGVSYDFTGCTGCMRFILSGHSHVANVAETHNGIPVIGTYNLEYYMREGVDKPTFDLCLADYDAGVLHMVRVGKGGDRSVTMAVRGGLTYTNLADPDSADWRNGYFLDPSETGTADPVEITGDTKERAVVTNYIPVKQYDILRIKGFDFNATADSFSPTLRFYDGDKKSVASQITAETSAGKSWGLPASAMPDENGVMTFTVFESSETGAQLDSYATRMQYVRVSALRSGSVDDVIVTVNEPIDGDTLITFTTPTGTYQAEDGMTWGEWIASEYNVDGYILNNGWVEDGDGGFIYDAADGGQPETADLAIIAGHTYIYD